MYTVDHTCAESSVHAQGSEIRGGNFNFSKLPWDAQGSVRWATDSQVCKRTSGVDPKTGTFHGHQTRVTVGDTACSVKGVLGII